MGPASDRAYDATSRADVDALVSEMRALSAPQRLTLLSVMHEGGLFYPPPTMRFGLWIISQIARLRKWDPLKARIVMWERMFFKDPTFVDPMWDCVCGHVATGRDRNDPRSVGGWCQAEVDRFAHAAAALVELPA